MSDTGNFGKFTKDGIVRIAASQEEAYKFKFDGWLLITPAPEPVPAEAAPTEA